MLLHGCPICNQRPQMEDSDRNPVEKPLPGEYPEPASRREYAETRNKQKDGVQSYPKGSA